MEKSEIEEEREHVICFVLLKFLVWKAGSRFLFDGVWEFVDILKCI
jgi:hypothetical protein